MAQLQLSGTATELTVDDLMTVAARPNSRIALVDIVAGSPEFKIIVSNPEGRRRWKVVGVGMTPPSVGTKMVLTLEIVEGDGQILPGDRLRSGETGYRDGSGSVDSASLPPSPPP